MHLKVQKRNGREYLSVVQSYRQGGKVKTRTVETIGYADRYADDFPDPIAHFRSYVEQLNAQAVVDKQPIALSFGVDDAIAATAAPPARLGAAIALGCLDAIGVGGFFRARAGRDGFPAHAGRIFEMLAAERMMHATSKRESWAARASFPRSCDFAFEDVYAALPCFAREEERLSSHLLRTWERRHDPHRHERIYIAVGSYSFPWNGAQQTTETRSSTAVAMDPDGMPLGYHVIDGRLDAKALLDAADLLKQRLDARQAVVIVGTLHQFEPYLQALAAAGHGFVLYQADAQSTPGLAEWAEDPAGFQTIAANVQAKSRTAVRSLADGGTVPVAEVLLKGGGYALQRGRAILVSSETELGAAATAQLFRELWRQAEPFQPLEADFSAMPAPVSPHDHVHAHFAICYAAFFALRSLRRKAGWQHNAAAMADALLRMEGTHLQQNYYLFNYRNAVTDDIERAVGIPLARRLRTRADLRTVPGTVSRAIDG